MKIKRGAKKESINVTAYSHLTLGSLNVTSLILLLLLQLLSSCGVHVSVYIPTRTRIYRMQTHTDIYTHARARTHISHVSRRSVLPLALKAQPPRLISLLKFSGNTFIVVAAVVELSGWREADPTEYRCYRLILKTEGRRRKTQGAGGARFPLSRISFIPSRREGDLSESTRSLPRFADILVLVSLLREDDRRTALARAHPGILQSWS